MPDPTWESADPALRALVEAVENESLDYYSGALALRGAARMALVRYVEGRVEKAVADGLSGERIYWLPECPEHGQRDINELMYLATENNAPPFVVRVERAVVLADGWVAVRPDPTDMDGLLVTEHETKEDATRALKGAPDA